MLIIDNSNILWLIVKLWFDISCVLKLFLNWGFFQYLKSDGNVKVIIQVFGKRLQVKSAFEMVWSLDVHVKILSETNVIEFVFLVSIGEFLINRIAKYRTKLTVGYNKVVELPFIYFFRSDFLFELKCKTLRIVEPFNAFCSTDFKVDSFGRLNKT